ncbi:hypothetical protein SteCoe_37731 [Stentor coeruleus]|uniref:C2H2-type domain-containing protein n=1 Tax=Stentor coeruleus TaxID=5963 RepID=A0A1R2AMV6_9CILI|nr:hypothetical protein SteCoe_37731 [Stentor coeruleus]
MDFDALIAWGSTFEKCFIVMNTMRKVMIVSFDINFAKIGVEEIMIFDEEISHIEKAYFLSKANRLFILTSDKQLFNINIFTINSQAKITQEINKNNSSIIIKINPPENEKFEDVFVTNDEKIYITKSGDFIEIYNMKNIRLNTIPLNPEIVGIKVVSYNDVVVIVMKKSEKLSFAVFKTVEFNDDSDDEVDEVDIEVNERGNPTIDAWYLGLQKYGSSKDYLRLLKGDRKLCVLCKNNKFEEEIKKYLKQCSSIIKNFPYLKNYKNSDIISLWKKNYFFTELSCRVPVHVAIIDKGNLIPLQNGENKFDIFIEENPKNKDYLLNFIEFIKFSHLEIILPKITSPIIIGILGEQALGKSTLLNRLFGTRYEVKEAKCTEGIWISLAYAHDKFYIILDCEGFFSNERTLQEEMKLSLLFASLADVIIINTNLHGCERLNQMFENFSLISDRLKGKMLNQMFENFSLISDRLKGKNLFKGRIDLFVRDVDNNEVEVMKKINEIINKAKKDEKKRDSFAKIFEGTIKVITLENFQSPEFENQIDKECKIYKDNKSHFGSGEEFLLYLKLALVQIFSDDDTSFDDRLLELNSSTIKKTIKPFVYKPLPSIIFPGENLVKINFESKKNIYNLQANLNSITLQKKSEKLNSPFYECLESFELLKSTSHNQLYQSLDSLIKRFFNKKNEMLIKYLYILYEKYPTNTITETILSTKIDKKINSLAIKYSLCLGKCINCEFYCVKIFNHKKQCDCQTNHKCPNICQGCNNNKIMCSISAGHEGWHSCEKMHNTCGIKCSENDCDGKCVNNARHEGLCRCSKKVHECFEKCEQYEKCGNKCRKDRHDDHKTHDCTQKQCLFKCLICDNLCASKDHFHDKNDQTIISHPITGHSTKIHLCNSSHQCYENCSNDGICHILIINTSQIFRDYNNKTIKYPYTKQTEIKKKCIIIIPPGEYKHDNPHKCDRTTDHLCKAKCPDCFGYCHKPYGHKELHSSDTHRNKEKCIYISTMKTIEREIETETGLTMCKFIVGDISKPENCISCCMRNGRGHYHPLLCKGKDLCLEKAIQGNAIHSQDTYIIDGNLNSENYDVVSCSIYWKILGWEPPVSSKSPERQKFLDKCSFFCTHESHQNHSFCDLPLFHSLSQNRSDHVFPSCSHSLIFSHDIIFIIDITSSMISCFSLVKSVISSLIERWENKDDILFAAVGYGDHCGKKNDLNWYQEQVLDPKRPVICYPKTRKIIDSKNEEVANFIGTMKIASGWMNGGEAMIDGISEGLGIILRYNSRPVYIVVGNENPHGKEFSKYSCYPNGCPCGINWKKLLERIKSKEGILVLVQLDVNMDDTAKLFSMELGNNFLLKNLQEINDDFIVQVCGMVSRVISKDLEFARGIEWVLGS